MLKAYNPSEPRDERGRWTSGGSSSAEPASQKEAVDWYTNSGASMVNRLLRRDQLEHAPDEVQESVKALDAFTRSEKVNQSTTVFRAITDNSPTGKKIPNLKPGTILSHAGYLSTTKTIEGAEDFSDQLDQSGIKLMQINLPKGATFGPAYKYSIHDEQEILLPRGASLKYVGPVGDAFSALYEFDYIPPVKKAYNPSEPRDSKGKWTSSFNYGGVNLLTPATEEEKRLQDAVWAKVSDRMRRFLTSWSKTGYKRINEYLRNGKTYGLPASILEERVKGLDAFTKIGQLENNKTVYRIVREASTGGALLAGLKPGQTVENKGFTSVSFDKRALDKLVLQDRGPTMRMNIAMPKGATFGPMYLMSEFPQEKEWLLPRGSRLKYLGTSGKSYNFNYIPPVKKYDPNEPRDNRGRWTASGAGESSTAKPISDDELLSQSKQVASSFGFDPDKVQLGEAGKTFELDGKQMRYAGSANLQDGTIAIYPGTIPNTAILNQVIAHEVMHQDFEGFLNSYLSEARAIGALEDQGKKVRGADDNLLPAYKNDFPNYAAYQRSLTGGTLNALTERDGISDYSRAWWSAWKNNAASVKQAIHETLAEMAAFNTLGAFSSSKDRPTRRLTGTKEWNTLYDDVLRSAGKVEVPA